MIVSRCDDGFHGFVATTETRLSQISLVFAQNISILIILTVTFTSLWPSTVDERANKAVAATNQRIIIMAGPTAKMTVRLVRRIWVRACARRQKS
jgi:hypothetical protein